MAELRAGAGAAAETTLKSEEYESHFQKLAKEFLDIEEIYALKLEVDAEFVHPEWL